MAQATNDRFRFNLSDIALREELHLTERQRFLARCFFEGWHHTYIDVLPTTVIVPKDVAESKLEIKHSVVISGVDSEHVHVFAAPEFRTRKFVKNPQYTAGYYKWFVNIAKDDLKVITVFDTAPSLPADDGQRTCVVCQTPHNEHKEGRLFALPCGHWACRSCWRSHCEFYLMRGMSPIPCAHGDCGEQLTVGRAAVLLSDEALKLCIANEWRKMLGRKDRTVRCAGCRHWIKLTEFCGKTRYAICTCGCFTCLGCGKADHTPLRCKDAAVWAHIRAIESEDEAAAKAEKVWGLTRENFDDCLSPSKDIASEQFKNNLRHMRYDRKHGKILEKSMPIVARMLELRLVQQFANRKEMRQWPINAYSEGVDQRWSNLEKYFTLALDTLEETRHKAKWLDDSRGHVLCCYALENL